MFIFGIDVPILELLIILSMIIVIYLIILEFEFRQLRKITKKFDEEEVQLGVEMRELRKEIGELRSVVSGLKPARVAAKK